MAPVTHITLGALNQLIDQELPRQQDRGDQEVQRIRGLAFPVASIVPTAELVSQEVSFATVTTTVVIIQMNGLITVRTVPRQDLGDLGDQEQLRVQDLVLQLQRDHEQLRDQDLLLHLQATKSVSSIHDTLPNVCKDILKYGTMDDGEASVLIVLQSMMHELSARWLGILLANTVMDIT